ncbi:Uma2 family endonuclease [soil metagenome]
MVQAEPSYVSYEEYLEAEQKSETKHEWLDGVIYAMAGGTLEHSRLASNMNTALKTAHPNCEVFQSDAMLFVRATQLSTYADVTIVCGPIESQKVERSGRVLGEALLNPSVIVEVLSDSTADYDRGEKFAHYMRIPSLKEYVLVSQDSPKIEVFRRPDRGHWSHEEAAAGELIQILGRAIVVDDIFRKASPSSK